MNFIIDNIVKDMYTELAGLQYVKYGFRKNITHLEHGRPVAKIKKKSRAFVDKEFYKLQKKWYDKLKKEGFDDIEGGKPGLEYSDFIKRHSLEMKKAYNPKTEEYYRRCRIHANHGSFDTNLQKYVFTCHAEGHSYRKIIKMVRARFKRSISVFYISDHVNKVLKRMNEERHWENGEDDGE